jgi:hypothetical protein
VASTVALWTPPDGMNSLNVKAWRAFYSRVLDVYGLTPADYRLLYVAQKGRCWICRKAKGIHPDDPRAAGGRRLGVDHDHRTGEVRGLLCTVGDKACNRIIGWLNAAQLLRASQYLMAHGQRPARVLQEMRHQVGLAEVDGAELSQDEIDALAVMLLWPDESHA